MYKIKILDVILQSRGVEEIDGSNK